MIVRFSNQPVPIYITIIRASSSFTPYKPNKQQKYNDKPSLLTGFGTRLKNRLLGKDKERLLGGRSPAPLNLNYPNKKGIDDFHVYTSLDEAVVELPPLVKEHAKRLKDEYVEQFCSYTPDYMDGTIGPVHDQTSIEYDFKTEESLKRWQTGCDSIWNQGRSTCKFERTEHNTAIFSGNLSTKLIGDGKVNRAGWASIRTVDYLAFQRKRYLRHWMNYSHVLVKCRGDGRSYKLILHFPGHIDMFWFDSHSFPLHTHGGPYWQYEKIPFSRFFHTIGGRIQDKQSQIPAFQISNIGITLMDRVDGPFKLEIDYIGVINDRTHEEVFAYETYSLPVYNTSGM